MPIMDGLTSTKMIRSIEKSQTDKQLSERAALNGRIPIFAVSASLLEKERQKYVDAGFDGWILKPIDFKRLNILMRGIVDDAARDSCVYQSGQWEKGGWFQKRQPGIYEANTIPSQKPSTRQSISAVAETEDGDATPTPRQSDADGNDRLQPGDNDVESQSNSTTPTGETPQAASDTDSVNTTPATADRQSGIMWEK
jgi:CheY-like chemotaxis protein